MLAHLVKKPNGYLCSNCRMAQNKLEETCWFCGYFFSNYEVILMENYKARTDQFDKNF